MISRNELKYLRSLHLKKFRDEEKKFIAEGKNGAEEGLKSDFQCSHVLFTRMFWEENANIRQLAEQKKIKLTQTSESTINRIADSVSPQGIVCVFDIPEAEEINFESIAKPVVYLDEISDPGNLGTIIRTCDWFGFTRIVISKNSADIYNPKTIRSSAGSVFHVNLYPDKDIEIFAETAKKAGFRVFSTGKNGESLETVKWMEKMIIVFSNEASGMSAQVNKTADYNVTIPRYGKAESLNVAAAAAVVLSRVSSFL